MYKCLGCTYVYVRCVPEARGGRRGCQILGTGVTDSFKLPLGSWVRNLNAGKEQQVLMTWAIILVPTAIFFSSFQTTEKKSPFSQDVSQASFLFFSLIESPKSDVWFNGYHSGHYNIVDYPSVEGSSWIGYERSSDYQKVTSSFQHNRQTR